MAIKVMHVTYDMRIGGTEMVIKNIVEGFEKLYPQVSFSIFCIETPLGPWGQMLLNDGIEIDSVCRKPGFDWSLIRAIRRSIVKRRIDIIHCHQYTPWVYGLLASIGTQAKVIFTEHGRFYPDFSSWKRLRLNPWFSRLSAAITAISLATKQALVDYEGIKAKNIQVIYNGLKPLCQDEDKIAAIRAGLGLGENHFLFGTVARFDPIKNQRMMIRAFAKVVSQHANVRLLMVGDGDEFSALQALTNDLGIKEAVIFTGYISEPENYIGAMDVFLLSSLSEGTSMTLLEAMSLGKSCVVTNAGGNAEIVTDRETGFVTPNNNEAAFSEAMINLLEDQRLRDAFSRGGLERFNQRFSIQNMVKRYFDLYQKVCRRN